MPIVLLIVGLLRPELMLGSEALTASMVWSLVGAFFSYLGLLMSSYALLEVKSLASRYLTKQRLPEIKKQLEKITKSLASLAEARLVDMRGERVISESAVMLRQARKTRISSLLLIVKRAEVHHRAMEQKLQSQLDPLAKANDFAEYWNLFRTLTELTDEIEEHNKGARASL